MQALAMDFAGDKKTLNMENEYLFGKYFLVCPVTGSVKTQKIYLPEGGDRTDFWTGEKVEGGQELTREYIN